MAQCRCILGGEPLSLLSRAGLIAPPESGLVALTTSDHDLTSAIEKMTAQLEQLEPHDADFVLRALAGVRASVKRDKDEAEKARQSSSST